MIPENLLEQSEQLIRLGERAVVMVDAYFDVKEFSKLKWNPAKQPFNDTKKIANATKQEALEVLLTAKDMKTIHAARDKFDDAKGTIDDANGRISALPETAQVKALNTVYKNSFKRLQITALENRLVQRNVAYTVKNDFGKRLLIANGEVKEVKKGKGNGETDKVSGDPMQIPASASA